MPILNYYPTQHFLSQTSRRGISAFMISLCLAKGRICQGKSGTLHYRLEKEALITALKSGYLEFSEVWAVRELIVVTKRRRLITAFLRHGDTGIGLANAKC